METDKLSRRQALAVAMAAGAAAGRVSLARLMSPIEVAAATRGRGEADGRVQGWYVCAEVPRALWLAMQPSQREHPMALVLASTETGRTYAVVVHQARGLQHRLCVPLVGAATASWVAALCEAEPLQLALACEGECNAVVTRTLCPPEAIGQLRDACTALPEDRGDLVEEALTFGVWNVVAGKVEGVAGLPLPGDVAISVLLPSEMQAEAEAKLEQMEGRQFN